MYAIMSGENSRMIETTAATILQTLDDGPDRRNATVRSVRKTFSKQIKDWPAEDVVALALALINELPDRDRWMPYELIHFHKPALRSLDANTVEQLGEGMASWYQVDGFAPFVAGIAWREGQIDDAVIHRWARSEDRWWRRAALVSTLGLNTRARGGTGDAPRTLAVCDLLLEDRDDMVVKAMSWALRELVVWDAQAVADYIEQHEDVLAARVKREVRNKLETGVKNPR